MVIFNSQKRLIRKKVMSGYILLLILIAIPGCGGLELESSWANQPITVDGNYNDWEKIPTHFDRDKEIIYGITNDNDDLYVMFRFRDRMLARKIEHRGMILWLNDEGQEDKILGIQYGNDRIILPENREMGPGKPGSNKADMKPMTPSGVFTLVRDNTVDIIKIDEKEGFAANVNLNSGMYCYEFKIPLSPDAENLFTITTDRGSKINIGFEIKGLSEEELAEMKNDMKDKRKEMDGRQGGMGGSRPGGGMPSGGGMGSGRPGGSVGGMGAPGGGSPNNMLKQFETQKYWFDVQLASTDGTNIK